MIKNFKENQLAIVSLIFCLLIGGSPCSFGSSGDNNQTLTSKKTRLEEALAKVICSTKDAPPVGSELFDECARLRLISLGGGNEVIRFLLESMDECNFATELIYSKRYITFIWYNTENRYNTVIKIMIGFDPKWRPLETEKGEFTGPIRSDR